MTGFGGAVSGRFADAALPVRVFQRRQIQSAEKIIKRTPHSDPGAARVIIVANQHPARREHRPPGAQGSRHRMIIMAAIQVNQVWCDAHGFHNLGGVQPIHRKRKNVIRDTGLNDIG